MSSPESLAAVTDTLKELLKSVVGDNDANVTVKPPSTARSGVDDDQLNIFLYSVRYNSAFRNEPMPGKAKNGELSYPPMPLILNYLLTAYGKGDDDLSGQKVLGRAMSILHDHPILSRAELEKIEADAGLHQQFERIRITPDTLSLDDMSKLWSSFQSAEYRLSVGYEVSVVLIESRRTGKAPLPVVKRGEENRGVHALPSPLATLKNLAFLNQKPAAELGDSVILLGEQLSKEHTTVRFSHPLMNPTLTEFTLPLESTEKGSELAVTLQAPPPAPSAPPAPWPGPAGFYTLSLLIEHPHLPKWTSNQLAMPLAAKITGINPRTVPANNDFLLTLESKPKIWAGQEAALIFNDQIIQPTSIDDTSTGTEETSSTLRFNIKAMPAQDKSYAVTVRLRVDGVDSIPVIFSNPPKFDDNQQVKVIP